MRNALSVIMAVALLGLATPAAAGAAVAKGVPYKGKTSGGHPVTFSLDKKRMRSFSRTSSTPSSRSRASITTRSRGTTP